MATNKPCAGTSLATDNTELTCNEFYSTECVIHPDALVELSLPENSQLNSIISAILSAVTNLNNIISQNEEERGIDIQVDGSVIKNEALKLNFLGNILAAVDSGDPDKVNVQIDMPNYSLTLGVDNVLNILEDSTIVSSVNLSSLLDDTNLSRVVSGSVSGNTLILTRDDTSTIDIDVSSLMGVTGNFVTLDTQQTITAPKIFNNTVEINESLTLKGSLLLDSGTAIDNSIFFNKQNAVVGSYTNLPNHNALWLDSLGDLLVQRQGNLQGGFKLKNNSTESFLRTYNLPDKDGTFAMTSDLPNSSSDIILSPSVNNITNLQTLLEDHESRIDGLASGGSDGVVTNVTFTGNNLNFTGTGGAFNSNVDLSSLATTTLLGDYGFTDNSTDWDTAFGWGDHSVIGYLTSYTETDPIFIASQASNITNQHIIDLNNLSGVNTGDQTAIDVAYSFGGTNTNVSAFLDELRINAARTNQNNIFTGQNTFESFSFFDNTIRVRKLNDTSKFCDLYISTDDRLQFTFPSPGTSSYVNPLGATQPNDLTTKGYVDAAISAADIGGGSLSTDNQNRILNENKSIDVVQNTDFSFTTESIEISSGVNIGKKPFIVANGSNSAVYTLPDIGDNGDTINVETDSTTSTIEVVPDTGVSIINLSGSNNSIRLTGGYKEAVLRKKATNQWRVYGNYTEYQFISEVTIGRWYVGTDDAIFTSSDATLDWVGVGPSVYSSATFELTGGGGSISGFTPNVTLDSSIPSYMTKADFDTRLAEVENWGNGGLQFKGLDNTKSYKVRLYVAEQSSVANGARVWSATWNGNSFITNMDLQATYGANVMVMFESNAESPSGTTLDIDFTATADVAIWNAIELIEVN